MFKNTGSILWCSEVIVGKYSLFKVIANQSPDMFLKDRQWTYKTDFKITTLSSLKTERIHRRY